MDDIEILNGQENGDEEQDIAHFILDHDGLAQSEQLMGEIDQHFAAINEIAAQLNVAVESHHGSIATEGFADTIKEYWQKFVDFLKRVWAKIVEFFELHFTILGRRRLHINRMLKLVRALSTNPDKYQHLQEAKDFQIKAEHAQSFLIGGQPCANFESLNKGMEKTEAAVKLITVDYSKYIGERAALIEKAIQSAKAENAPSVLARVMEELTHNAFSQPAADMLGNVVVTYGAASSAKADENNLDQYRLTLTQKPAGGAAIQFHPMLITELAKVYESMGSVLDTVDAFKNGEYKTIVQHYKTMLSDTDRFVNAVSGFFKSSDSSDAGVSAYKAIMALNKHYLSWIKAPTTDLVRYVTTSFFYVGVEMETNVAMYKPHPAVNLFKVLGLSA